jgi:hypothetical protein
MKKTLPNLKEFGKKSKNRPKSHSNKASQKHSPILNQKLTQIRNKNLSNKKRQKL